MTNPRASNQYALGSDAAEQERLIQQSAWLTAHTERFFRRAGIGPGQRVLDLGAGVGEVALIAGRLVGSSGKVVGAERWMPDVLRSLAPQIRALDLPLAALGDLGTLYPRLMAEAAAHNVRAPLPGLIGAWARKPG